jgi:hypothetical protein
MTAPRYNSRRADCPGYLEFIWRLPTDAPHPQAIAYITEDEGYGTLLRLLRHPSCQRPHRR